MREHFIRRLIMLGVVIAVALTIQMLDNQGYFGSRVEESTESAEDRLRRQQLLDLVQRVERYRQAEGNYPGSLAQLGNPDPPAYFHYETDGASYRLAVELTRPGARVEYTSQPEQVDARAAGLLNTEPTVVVEP